jgi:hypothetical protein
VDAEAWMHGYGCVTCDCLAPFSSNLKVSEAVCLDGSVWMAGMDASQRDRLTPISSNLKVRLHVWMWSGCMWV